MASAFPVAQVFEGFRRQPPAQRLGMLAALAMLASIAVAWWMYSQTPDFQVLYSNLSDRDGGSVVGALTQMNIPYKVAEGGGAILVPGGQVHETRLKLASQGLPKGSIVGFELLDGQKLGATQFQEQVAFQRGLEGELARSIQALSAVAAARVHLAIPRTTSFLRDVQKPSASVLVNLHPGKTLDRAQVAGIVHLVASSVAELDVKAVSVVDQNGVLLSSAASEGAGLDASQLAYVREMETNLSRRVEEIVEPIVGRGNVRAQVTADIDFSSIESTAETYKPNGTGAEATIRSQTISERGAAAAAAAQGIPGAASNQPKPATPPASASVSNDAASSAQKESTTQYEVDRIVKREKAPTGNVKRLSAAVVVNHLTKSDADGKVESTPLSKDQLSQIDALVREALGFNEKRGDSLNIANAPFATEPTQAVAERPFWKDPGNISLAKEIGKNLLGALFVAWIVMGVIRPLMRNLATAGAAAQQQMALEGANAPLLANKGSELDTVRTIARQDPQVVANVVKGWVSGNE